MSKNLSELSGKKGLRENLFEELGVLAAPSGAVSKKDMEKLADDFLMGDANVYGTATFYDFLRPENQAKKCMSAMGVHALPQGRKMSLKKNLANIINLKRLVKCVLPGRCHENSSFNTGGKNYSGPAVNQIKSIKENGKVVIDQYNLAHYGAQILTAPFTGIDTYYKTLGLALGKSRDELLSELKVSGLRGRGGAFFPIAFKLESCKNTPGENKFIVCNADEGDPGAYSDRYLLEHQPHALLLGMMIAGYIAGANAGVVYIRAEYPESIEITQKAISDIHEKGFLGENILGSGFNFDFKLIKAQGAYICGEETALLNSIEGQRPEVRTRPPYPTQHGLFNRPTVVNNVETLACIPWVIKNGGAAYAAIGRGKSTGTKLVSLDGFFNNPGIYEVDMGTPLSVVVDELGGGYKTKIKAMHIGRPLGGIIPMHKVNDLTIDVESFAQNGFLFGHASVVCIPETFPMIHYLEHLFEFTEHESCGKCFPCRLGSTRGKEMIHKSVHEDYKMNRELFTDLITTMEIGSLCALGGGLPLGIRNALQYFDEELKGYFE